VIEDVDHLGIVVADLEESHRFVCEVLGFAHCESVDIPGRLRARFYTKGGCELEVIEVTEPSERVARLGDGALAKLDHVALRASDVAATIQELETAGVAFGGEGLRTIGGRDFAFSVAQTSQGVRFQVIAPRSSGP
jgi:catechol 2,3-dioxygenase-like lactoylglutathione lyase family enzyme